MEQKQIRLSPEVREAIVNALERCFPFKGAKAYLFGSRTNPRKRGGDVDILIVIDEPKVLKNTLKTILDFEACVIKKSDDQKIDTKVISRAEFQEGKIPFIEVIKENLVELWEYHDE